MSKLNPSGGTQKASLGLRGTDKAVDPHSAEIYTELALKVMGVNELLGGDPGEQRRGHAQGQALGWCRIERGGAVHKEGGKEVSEEEK